VEELVKVLKDGLMGAVPSENFIVNKSVPDDAGKLGRLPFVAVYDSGFKVEEPGVGLGVGESNKVKREIFSGDGKKKVFRLNDKPLRSLINVESPIGSPLREPDEVRTDYSSSSIIFRIPPLEGTNNVSVTYTTATSAGEVRGLRLKITYNIDMWAKDPIECNSLTIEGLKIILLSKEKLVANGIHITPIEGINIIETDMPHMPDGAIGKRLVYVADVDIKAEMKIPLIEKIELRDVSNESVR
jgi:hypothetical protein